MLYMNKYRLNEGHNARIKTCETEKTTRGYEMEFCRY